MGQNTNAYATKIIQACSHVLMGPTHTVVVEQQQQDSDEWGHFADFCEDDHHLPSSNDTECSSCTSLVASERINRVEKTNGTDQGAHNNYFHFLFKHFYVGRA